MEICFEIQNNMGVRRERIMKCNCWENRAHECPNLSLKEEQGTMQITTLGLASARQST